MERYLRGVLMCLLGLGLMTEAFEVEVKDESGSNICIYASMKVNFTIQYETNTNKSNNATLVVPDEVTTNGSTCGGKDVAPLLVVNFGSNHSLRLNFTSDGVEYSVDMIVFTYNTNDSVNFPNATQKGLVSTFMSVREPIPVNATYVCLHEAVVVTENVVQVYQNVSLLAFSQDKPFTKEFHCSADTSTTQAPVTPNITTPNTPSTTPTPTTKPVDKPTIGNYTVLNGTETCLLASMGLQLNATLLVDGKNVWTPLNIDPRNTTSSGSCGNDSALLRLNDNGTIIVEFYFSVRNKNFYLQEVNVTLANASGMSVRTNSNLSLWDASLGSSYLCHKEQTITVSDDLYMNTFDVRVQPFGVKNATYATGSFNKRRRNSIFVTVTLFLVSILILTVGLAATTRTENVTVGGYYPGVILGFGSMLGIIGSNLIENKRQMLVASIVFISFGVIAAFCCAIVDGVFAARHLDLRPIYAGRCRYFPSAGDDQATDSTEITCQMPTRGSCSVKIKSNTCYCCELYNCGRAGISGLYYEYIDVTSCDDVVHLYHLLWSVTILNIVGLFLGIITAAVLGGFKDMNPTIPAISCIVETPRPTVQYNTRPPVPSYNTYYHSTPHLPPYTAYDLQHSTVFPASTPSGLSDDPNSTSQSGPSFMWPSTAPPRYSPPYFPPDEKPPPYTP